MSVFDVISASQGIVMFCVVVFDAAMINQIRKQYNTTVRRRQFLSTTSHLSSKFSITKGDSRKCNRSGNAENTVNVNGMPNENTSYDRKTHSCLTSASSPTAKGNKNGTSVEMIEVYQNDKT